MRNLSYAVNRLIILVFFFVCSQAAAYDGLIGMYRGLDSADGIMLEISSDSDGYRAEMIVNDGAGLVVFADGFQDGALEGIQGPLTLQNRAGIVEFTPRPLGLSFVWQPEDGGDALIYAFHHQKIEIPDTSARHIAPPIEAIAAVDPVDFLNSYELWQGDQVGSAYDTLLPQYRGIIKAFATVHTDILWKLCRASASPRELPYALTGQGTTCETINARLKASQLTDGFTRFKRRVNAEKADALRAVECVQGFYDAETCALAAERMQKSRAIADTAASVIQRF